MLRYMLDTNIVIYTIKNKPPEVKVRFNAVATQLCVSSITVAELIYGAENSQNPIKN
ncbi:PIN domain-containing protein, partial [Acinetobacter baumannii]